MSRIDRAFDILEQRWQLSLPETFLRLYHAFAAPSLTVCDFLSLEELADDAERWRGMMPSFLPFAYDGDSLYGFYAAPFAVEGEYPILLWEEEHDHYSPIASDFDAFLRWGLLTGWYADQDVVDEEEYEEEEDVSLQQAFVQRLGLSPDLLIGTPPRNERELFERLAESDPLSAHALSVLGAMAEGRGDHRGACAKYVLATDAMPWFSDPHFLLARVEHAQQRTAGVLDSLRSLFHCPIALSTDLGRYGIRTGVFDREIHEAAVEMLIQYRGDIDPDWQETPLGRLLLDGTPFEPASRLSLAERLMADDDVEGAERELLNALTLATEEEDTAAVYGRLIAFYTLTDRPRDLALCRRDARRE